MKPVFKTSMTFAVLLFLVVSALAQKSFTVSQSFLSDSSVLPDYKLFTISERFDVSGWGYGERLKPWNRFTADSGLMNLIDNAIKQQYYDALVHSIDSSWRWNERIRVEHKGDSIWKAPPAINEQQITAFKAELKKNESEDYDRNRYDKYLFGYRNNKGDKMVLVLFDPHVLKSIEIGGEGHQVNPGAMVYAIKTRKLNFWGYD